MALLVKDCEGCHGAEVNLTLQGLLLLLYFEVVMHFSNLIIIIRQ